jgi:uncharacterized membrane protein YkoI
MDMRRKMVFTGAAALALAAGGVGAANAVGGHDGDEQATGPDADRAKSAALRLVPGGKVNAVERDSEKGATWQVEVAKPDGSTVDVFLGAAGEKPAIDGDSDTSESGR